MSFDERSTALIEILDDLNASSLAYVLVGGYAVSAFNTRFSTDLDIVVAPNDKSAFDSFLDERAFEQTDSHAKEWFYDTEVIEYEKRLGSNQPIGFDLLVNGLGCRQTEAQWSFDYLQRHSTSQTVKGTTATTQAQIVDGAVLIAAKLHSGRETDFRDVLAVAEDIEMEQVTPHLHRGDADALREQLERGLDILESDQLKHGFKSDFGTTAVSPSTIEAVRRYLEDQIDQLS